jgi:hypothetical protein
VQELKLNLFKLLMSLFNLSIDQPVKYKSLYLVKLIVIVLTVFEVSVPFLSAIKRAQQGALSKIWPSKKLISGDPSEASSCGRGA